MQQYFYRIPLSFLLLLLYNTNYGLRNSRLHVQRNWEPETPFLSHRLRSTVIVRSLTIHDGNAKENVTLKMTSNHFKLVRDSFNSFNLSDVAEQSGSWLFKDGVTVQLENREFTAVVCLRSKYNFEFGHFTLLFCRGRQRNAPKSGSHVQSHCFVN